MSIERRRTKAGVTRYSVRIKHSGRIVAMKTFGRKADAETWEREQYRALQFGEFIPPSQSTMRFAEVVQAFLESRRGQVVPHTWRTDRDNLANTPDTWAALPISAISEADILDHLTKELESKAHATVSRARTTLSALFQYAVREKMRLRNPVRDVPMPAGEQTERDEVTPFTDAELLRTLTAQRQRNPQMAEVTEFLSLTGLRWSELRALRVRNLQDMPYPGLRVSRAQSDGYEEKGTKTKKWRPVPLTDRAYEIARSRAVGREPEDYLFRTKNGLQLKGNLFRRYVRWTETASGHTIHDLRHYAASTWLRAGIPVHQVAKWLGHANPSTTLRVYAHVLGEGQDIAAITHLNNQTSVRTEYAPDQYGPNLGAAVPERGNGPSLG
jgi:integrase